MTHDFHPPAPSPWASSLAVTSPSASSAMGDYRQASFAVTLGAAFDTSRAINARELEVCFGVLDIWARADGLDPKGPDMHAIRDAIRIAVQRHNARFSGPARGTSCSAKSH